MKVVRLLDHDVKLSNKSCRNAYVGRSVGGCDCPEGRCWYAEQVQRRVDGLKAIDPKDWPNTPDKERGGSE